METDKKLQTNHDIVELKKAAQEWLDKTNTLQFGTEAELLAAFADAQLRKLKDGR